MCREKVDLFSSWFRRASPARKWFNKLPDEGHRRWHLVREEFLSKWCTTTDTPALVALLSTDTNILPPFPDTPASATPPSDPILQLSSPEPIPTPDINTITTFTVSYTPLLHPEPSATRSGTNAIQVTQFELSKMLRQAFQQGSEQGYQVDLADAIKELNSQYEDRLSEASNDFTDRVQESSDNAFGEGFSAGIREERERWESRAPQVNVATQTNLATTTTSISVQTDNLVAFTPKMETASVHPHVIPSTSSATISTQTEPPLPTVYSSESLDSPVPISEPPIPATIIPKSFNWSDEAVSIIPTTPPKQPRDLSFLRSSSKNPFSSLRRRNHYSKHPQKNIFLNRYTQPYPAHQIHPPLHHTPPFPSNSLDWHHDPRLFELSRVLRTLGWSHH
jgi:hypothetical protein